MSSYPPQPPGYGPGAPPPYSGNAIPPYQQYQAPLPGQPGYQWGAGVPAYPYASFWARVGAKIIDGLIVTLIAGIPITIGVLLIVSGVSSDTPDGTTTVTNSAAVGIGVLIIIIGVVIALLYEPLLTARTGVRNGQTLGCQAVGIRITNLQGGPITAGQAWGRFAFRQFVISGVGSFFGGFPSLLNYLWMLWDPNKQCWHDKIASTFVLRV